MSIKSVFGLDGFDLSVHVAVTGILLFWVIVTNNRMDAMIGSSMVGTGSLVGVYLGRVNRAADGRERLEVLVVEG